MRPSAPFRTAVEPSIGRRRPRLPGVSTRIVLLGLASVCALLSEGAVADWSGVLLRDSLGAAPGQVGFGFAAFATTMTIGRITGDRVVAAFGRARSVGLLGGTGALGCAAGLASGSLVGVVIGFGFLGVGLATMFPTYLSAAADTDAPAGPLLATVTGLGYSGFLIGPTAIGLVAQASSVLSALWLVPVLTAASIGMGLVGIRLTRAERAEGSAALTSSV